MMDILMFAGLVVFASTFAIGMWALGRWLRSKGYGPQLDSLRSPVHGLAASSEPARIVGVLSHVCWGTGYESSTFAGQQE